jgi:hypothetical protein
MLVSSLISAALLVCATTAAPRNVANSEALAKGALDDPIPSPIPGVEVYGGQPIPGVNDSPVQDDRLSHPNPGVGVGGSIPADQPKSTPQDDGLPHPNPGVGVGGSIPAVP